MNNLDGFVGQMIERYFAPLEMEERNAQALELWRTRMALGETAIDPQPAQWRSCLDLWFADQRDLARRWMFIQRCNRKATQRLRQLVAPAQRSMS